MSPQILCADDQIPADDMPNMEIANTAYAADRECGVDFQGVVNRFCTRFRRRIRVCRSMKVVWVVSRTY